MNVFRFTLFVFALIGCTHGKPEPIEDPLVTDLSGFSQFIFMGDTGTGESDQYKVANGVKYFCQRNVCPFGLLLGDNFYPSGVESTSDGQWQSKFEKPYKDLKFIFYPVLGNHDHRGKYQAEIDYKSDRWKMPERYYKLETKYADIFALDTEKFDDRQLDWLEKELKKSTKPFRIVYGHHPVYSDGMHGDTSDLKDELLPVLKKYNVQFYLSGHDHHQQIIHKDGMTFVISGAGAKLRTVPNNKPFSKSILGFSHMKLTEDSVHLRMLDSNGNLLYEKEVY